MVRTWCVLYILTWKCASGHNGVHFFISHLASCLRTRRFSEPTFRPSGATNHWKNTVNRDFPTFSRICIFFLLIFSLLTLLTSAFQLSILSEVSLLNFLRICICIYIYKGIYLYIILYYIILYYIILYYIILYYIILYYIIILYHIILYYFLLNYMILYCIRLYCIILYYIV